MPKESENEEIDVTELIERIEVLEKENSAFKEWKNQAENRLKDCEDSVDHLAERVA